LTIITTKVKGRLFEASEHEWSRDQDFPR